MSSIRKSAATSQPIRLTLASAAMAALWFLLVAGGVPEGFPNPLATQGVFTGITFGQSGPVRIEAEVWVANLTDGEAYFRLDLFGNDGRPAVLDLHRGERSEVVFAVGAVAPGSVTWRTFNGEGSRLFSPSLFQGWGLFRANRAVDARVNLSVFDQRTGERTSRHVLHLSGRRLADVRLPILPGRSLIQSAIAVAVPGAERPVAVHAQLLRLDGFLAHPDTASMVAETTLVVPANGQQAATVAELFPDVAGHFIRLQTDDPTGLAASSVVFKYDSASQRLLLGASGFYDDAGQSRYAFGDPSDWGFDAGFRPSRRVGEATITSTDFGAFVDAPGSQRRFFPFAYPLVTLNSVLDLIIVGDRRAKIIVFGDGHVIEEPLPQHELRTRVLEDGFLEIEARFALDVGLTVLAHKLILIDPETRQIVGRFGGTLDQQPPWRQ